MNIIKLKKKHFDKFFFQSVFAFSILISWFCYSSSVVLLSKDDDKAPTKAFVNLVSFGDFEFGYRAFALKFQFLCDSYGHIKSISSYNYDNLMEWVDEFRAMPVKSNIITTVVATFYAYSSDANQRLTVVNKMLDLSSTNDNDWRNFLQGVYLFNMISKSKLKNESLKLKHNDVKNRILLKFEEIKSAMPVWAKVISSLVIITDIKDEKTYCTVFNIIKDIKKEDLMMISSDDVFGSINYNESISKKDSQKNKSELNSDNFLLRIISKRINQIVKDKNKYSCN